MLLPYIFKKKKQKTKAQTILISLANDSSILS